MSKEGRGKPLIAQGLLSFSCRRLLRFHAGPPGLPADGVLGLFRWHHLQYPSWGARASALVAWALRAMGVLHVTLGIGTHYNTWAR